jgi:thymidylate synthase (FAD)
MRLIKPCSEILLSNAIDFLRIPEVIESIGRTAYKSEDKITNSSAIPFVKNLILRGHESVIEHVSISVKFVCDRGVSHEMVRHRLASYTQESTRYCNYKGGVTFIIPPWVDIPVGEYFTYNEILKNAVGADCSWAYSCLEAEMAYITMLNYAWTPQQARSVLPNSLKTEIVMTANLREWRHFFKLRTAATAHPQMRELTVPALCTMRSLYPVVFDDIYPAPYPDNQVVQSDK